MANAIGKVLAWWLRLRGTVNGDSQNQEFATELEAHVAMHTQEGIRSGLSATDARRQALIALRGVEQTRQAYRERSTLPWVERLMQDLRFGLRMLNRNPGFTVVVVFTLAVGIGASSTVFTWINAVLIQPLGSVAEPDHLVTLESVTADGEWVPNSYPDFIDFRDHLKLFDGVAVTRPEALSVGNDNHADRVWAELVSGNYFAVLSVKPELGRTFLASEAGDTPGAYPVAVVSDRYWRSHYGADRLIAGKTIRVNQHELRRRREIGIRMAMGAQPGTVERLILRQGLVLTLIAIAVGWAAAWMLSKLASSFLYGIQPHDAATFTIVPPLLAVVALFACWLPARRTASIDPMKALRTE
jgi:hypothetical protein